MFEKIINLIFPKKNIKGNINSDGEKIYYIKGHRLYNLVRAEEFFRTEKGAEKAGFRRPLT